jgi:hypothetical protein
MRITDAATSEYLWAGRHEFKPEDLAPIQTMITRRISRELHVLLLQAASRRALATSGLDLEITECLSEASSALKGKVTPELTSQAQTSYLTALAHDPRNVEALTGLALTCQNLVSNPWWGDPRAAAAASDLGREAVAIALDLAPGHAVAKLIQGMLYSAAGQLELAERAFAQALGMDQAWELRMGLRDTMRPFLVVPMRRGLRLSGRCVSIRLIDDTASGSSLRVLRSCCWAGRNPLSSCSRSPWSETPAMAPHNFS